MTSRTMHAEVGRTVAGSRPIFSRSARPPTRAPNVVVIVLDDLGFAQLGCYGSSIATPSLDRLAARGLRYNNFHATPACAPSRACLITGRNHHAVGMGFLPEAPMGFPGYTARIPKSAATLPRILRDAGYNTLAVGKWHLTPRFEMNPSGPFDRWPLAMGFEHYYGFDAPTPAAGNMWAPNHMIRDNTVVDPPCTPDEGYHLTEDLASQAIQLIQAQQENTPDRPFFLYFAPFAVHEPHHVATEWTMPYRGQFDSGWESTRQQAFRRQLELGVVPDDAVLTERPAWVSRWEGLSTSARRLYAAQMETFAGHLTHTDAQIGRILDFMTRLDILNDTVIIAVSDNGASAEGGPHGHVSRRGIDDVDSMLPRINELGGFRALNHYAWGWAWAGNTPFKLWKRYAWLGGVRVPMIVHWPAGIAGGNQGQIRTQFSHLIDLMPTILDIAGIQAPEVLDGVSQQPVDGRTLFATFNDAASPGPRTTQYFEMMGSRAIYHDGWKATTDHVDSMMNAERQLIDGSHDFESDQWSLYRLADDFSEAHDLAAHHPDRLRQMIELWWHEAGRNRVLPLTDGWIERLSVMERPSTDRTRFVYRPGGDALTPPWSYLAGFQITADIEAPTDRKLEGVICAQGDWHGGWAWYLLGGHPTITFNFGRAPWHITAEEAVKPGRHLLGVTYQPSANSVGTTTILLDGREIAAGDVPAELTLVQELGFVGKFLVGRDQGFPVCNRYSPPFPFTGHLDRVIVDTTPPERTAQTT